MKNAHSSGSCQRTVIHTAAITIAALACGTVGAQPSASASGAAAPAAIPTAHPTRPAQFDRQTTQDFIDQAAYANRAEVAEARYVVDHTQSQAVKDFALKMIHDHTIALDRLQQVVARNGFVMPNGIDKKDRASMEELKHDSGARLDMAYSSAQERDHKDVTTKFRAAADNSSIAPVVRVYASSTLPNLEEHLHMAQQLVAAESKRPAG